jgi:hypothetical protein
MGDSAPRIYGKAAAALPLDQRTAKVNIVRAEIFELLLGSEISPSHIERDAAPQPK